ncbi:MAG: glycosyl hydrolase family 79 C-terminal domain-containing protein [Solirubrobacteraceae bacterium]
MDSRSRRWSPARTALALVAAALAAVVASGCGSAAQPPTRPTFKVTGAAVGHPIPPGFVGLSIEIKAMEQYTGTNPAAVNPVFLHLIADIAPEQTPVLRLGGDSTDWSWWPVSSVARPPGVRFTLTPNWLKVAHSVATTTRARLILGVDLEADNRTVAAAEANAMVDRIGRGSVAALELGNEPELYGSFGWYRSATGKAVPGRPRGYDPAAFQRDYSSFAATLPDVRLAGPSSGAPTWLAKLGPFLDAEPRVRLVTVHAYPLKHCTKSKVITIGQLLSDQSSRGLAATLAPYVAVADAHHDPLRVDEMNGISCGGTRGVSDSFASALWVLDALFELARTGVTGVNIHTVPGTINEIIGPVSPGGAAGGRVGAGSMRVHPEYYGMMMFAQAAPPGSQLLELGTATPPGVKVWATRAGDGVIHVVVVNKRLAKSQFLRLRIAGARATAQVEQLRAPSVRSTSGVTIGGQTFGAATATGVLSGPATLPTVTSSGGGYPLTVPPASATMLTIPAG